MAFLNYDGLLYFWQKIKALLAGKVDKIDGKGLSTNDYTTAEKTKLAGLKNYTHPTTSGNKISLLSAVPTRFWVGAQTAPLSG